MKMSRVLFDQMVTLVANDTSFLAAPGPPRPGIHLITNDFSPSLNLTLSDLVIDPPGFLTHTGLAAGGSVSNRYIPGKEFQLIHGAIAYPGGYFISDTITAPVRATGVCLTNGAGNVLWAAMLFSTPVVFSENNQALWINPVDLFFPPSMVS